MYPTSFIVVRLMAPAMSYSRTALLSLAMAASTSRDTGPTSASDRAIVSG